MILTVHKLLFCERLGNVRYSLKVEWFKQNILSVYCVLSYLVNTLLMIANSDRKMLVINNVTEYKFIHINLLVLVRKIKYFFYARIWKMLVSLRGTR